MKKGQIVKIVLSNDEVVVESIKKINSKGFSTKHYTFEKGAKIFHPTQENVKGCCLLNKTTLLHKITLGLF